MVSGAGATLINTATLAKLTVDVVGGGGLAGSPSAVNDPDLLVALNVA